MNRVYQTILKEFKGNQSEPTHVPEDFFIRIASVILKVPQLATTRLYEKLRICLVEKNLGDVDIVIQAAEERPEHVSIKNLKLLVDLYQFLPSKKNPQGEANTFTNLGRPTKTRNEALRGNQYNTIQTPVEILQKEAEEMRKGKATTLGNRNTIARYMSIPAGDSEFSAEQKS